MKSVFVRAAAAALFLALPLAACGDGAESGQSGHAEGEQAAEGPHGGRLLADGDFAIEITIFEAGQEPQFRVYAYRDDEPIDPEGVSLQMTLRRLGGKVDRFSFKPGRDYLAGNGVVEEPHSFDVEIVAVENGERHRWTYASYEGRTRIGAEAARQGGIEIARAGRATIGERRELFGTVELDPSARAEIRGQFPGRVVQVTKSVGQSVRRGELLARIESSESLQVYPVYSTVSGVIAERNGNPGDMTHDQPLYVITNPSSMTVVFNIFPRDLGLVRPGMLVLVETQDGQPVGTATLGNYLAEGNAEAGTALVRAAIPNRGGWIRPGMAMRGTLQVNTQSVPLAVRTEAIQPFRDFQVVYANYGDQYEVRMLELGRRGPDYTEVLSGIEPGTPYVAKGSFLVRADIEKSGAAHDH
jgi:cobalt-zinc-cadmium efflux system membrane fusion protein